MSDSMLITGSYAYTTTVLGGTVFAFFYLVSWCREIVAQLASAAAASATSAAQATLLARITTESLERKLDRLLERHDGS